MGVHVCMQRSQEIEREINSLKHDIERKKAAKIMVTKQSEDSRPSLQWGGHDSLIVNARGFVIILSELCECCLKVSGMVGSSVVSACAALAMAACLSFFVASVRFSLGRISLCQHIV